MAIRVPDDDVVNLTHVIGNFALPASSRSAYEHGSTTRSNPRSCDRESDAHSGSNSVLFARIVGRIHIGDALRPLSMNLDDRFLREDRIMDHAFRHLREAA